MASDPLLRIVDLHKRFGELEVLSGIDLEVARGEKVSIIGPSGSGKTTLLRCINYLEKPTAGRIYIDGTLIGEVLRVMRQLAEEGRTMVIVTHEIQFAGEVSDRIIFMDGGKIVEDGPPGQVLYAPQQPRTQAFLSRIQQR